MSGTTAGALPRRRAADDRPTVVVAVLWVGLAGWMGGLLGSFAIGAPHVLGVAAPPLSGSRIAMYPDGTIGAALASACVLLVYLWAWTLTVRGLFRLGSSPADRPAWTWTALTLAPALALALLPGLSITAPGIAAALALRHTAFGRDGTPRPEPFAVTRRTRAALGLALPILALGGVTAYAMYHPLANAHASGYGLKPGRADFVAFGPVFHNDGGRAVRILAVEPGVERGYALHLIGMKVNKRITDGVEPPWKPFAPFTLAPHHATDDLSMVLSRAGCRPGTSGRIESVRVRYRLGGAERTQLLQLDDPITLAC